MSYLSMMVRLILLYSVFLQLSKCNNVYDEIDAKILSDVILNKDVEIFNEKAMANIVKRINQQSYGFPDPRVGELLDKWDPESSVNPEELGTYFEGDILNPILDIDFDRNGIIGDNFRWPKGIIYYKYDANFDSSQKREIQRAMITIENVTCIKFRKFSGREEDYVSITNDKTGCWSSIGRRGGKQRVNFGPKCFEKLGTILHEFLHVIGFQHEQNRPDRDNYVTIMYQNIRPKYMTIFQPEDLNAFGVPYDYSSVMHYGRKYFSKNNKPTIVPKKKGVKIGQRIGLSKFDIWKIRAMYKCRGGVARV